VPGPRFQLVSNPVAHVSHREVPSCSKAMSISPRPGTEREHLTASATLDNITDGGLLSPVSTPAPPDCTRTVLTPALAASRASLLESPQCCHHHLRPHCHVYPQYSSR